jgi:hypothetical protein
MILQKNEDIFVGDIYYGVENILLMMFNTTTILLRNARKFGKS